MNKIFKGVMLSLLAMAGLASCGDDYDYTSADAPIGAQVYFPAETATSITISEDANSFSISLNRGTDNGSISVPLSVTGTEGTIYSVPSSVNFNDGETATPIVVSYDPSKIEYGRYDTLTIALNEEFTTPYGVSSVKIIAGATAWVDYGTALYRDDLITLFYAVDNDVYEVPIQKNIVKEGYYRLVNPYGKYYPYNEVYDDGTADWDQSVDSYMVINATDPDWVYVEDCETTMDWGKGAISVYGYVYFRMLNGYSLDDLKSSEPGMFGTLKDGIITMPAKSLLINMPGYNEESPGALYYTNQNGLFGVALPGYTFADYSIEVAYAGIYTDEKDNVFAVGNLTLGEDVKTVKAAVVKASDDADAVAAAIASGDLEAVSATSSRIEVPVTEGLTGKLKIVAVVLDGKDVKGVASASFEYYGGVNPWVEVGTGTYTYDFWWEGVDPGYKIYKRNDIDDTYKIEDWGGGVDFIFTWDGKDKVTVPLNDTGDVYSSYGTVYVSDMPTFSSAYISYFETPFSYEDYPCTYDDATNTFTFRVKYFVNGGWFDEDEVATIETLKVDWGASATARSAKAKSTAQKTKKASGNLKSQYSLFGKGTKAFAKSKKEMKSLSNAPLLVK